MGKSVVVYSYYSPEEVTGIGKYNGEMIDWLIKNNIEVISVTNAPFYPYWKVYDGFSNKWYSKKKLEYQQIRSYTYIPLNPSALKKVVSELSFFISSSFAILLNLKAITSAKVLIVVNPPFFLGLLPLLIGKFTNVKIIFHIQDLQIDAAKELKLLPMWLCNSLELFEIFLLKRAKFISTISPGMAKKLIKKNLNTPPLIIPNWASFKSLSNPKQPSKWLHKKLGLDQNLKLVVYSGNIGQKQGLEIIIEAAKALNLIPDIHFVILGAGLYKNTLKRIVENAKLANFTFSELVPKENLRDMLHSSFIQLIVQKSVGSDSFLPSKLTNILASGTASIITAELGTSLFELMKPSKAAYLIKPDSPEALVKGILNLNENENLRNDIKKNARAWAKNNLDIDKCLNPLIKLVQ